MKKLYRQGGWQNSPLDEVNTAFDSFLERYYSNREQKIYIKREHINELRDTILSYVR